MQSSRPHLALDRSNVAFQQVVHLASPDICQSFNGTTMQAEEEVTEEVYWKRKWKGTEGSEIIVDLWSGAVGIVHRASDSEDCTTSESQCVSSTMYLPELRARMQTRFGWLAISLPLMKDRAIAAGYGAFIPQFPQCSSVNPLCDGQQTSKVCRALCQTCRS